MARNVIPVQEILKTGLAVGSTGSETVGNVANGMQFANTDGRVILHVRNTSGAVVPVITKVLAAGTTGGPDGATVTYPTVSVPISSEMVIAFNAFAYNQTDGTIYLNLDSNGASLSFQALHF